MNPIYILLFLTVWFRLDSAFGKSNPEASFLQSPPPYIREPGIFYSDDSLLRLDIDLNNDGQAEVLLSMSRDQDGKQGNIWKIYEKKADDDFREIGTIIFSLVRFYLGEITEVGKYGLVTYGPAGGGEGILWAYVLNDSAIQKIKVGEVTRDRTSGERIGGSLLDKYTGAGAINGEDKISVLNAPDLAGEYGISIGSQTYSERFDGSFSVPTPAATAAQQGVRGDESADINSSHSQPSNSGTNTFSSSTAEKAASSEFPALAVVICCLVAAGGTIFFLRRK